MTEPAGASNEDLDVLARLLAEEGFEFGEAALIPPRPPLDELPLSYAQQRLWFLDQLQPGNTVYNITTAVRLKGRLDITALERTLSEIERRHETLRTTFASVEGRPAQVIGQPRAIRIPVVDLSHLPAEEREAEALRLCREEALRPFDLSAGPLWRALLARLSDEEHVAALTMHHIVSDGWSMDVLVREVAALYEAFAQGRPSPLEELPVQYADYAVWQREQLRGEALDGQLSYWRERLRELPTLALPTDRPRPATQSFRGAKQTMLLSVETTDALVKLGRQEGATLFMVLLAGLAALLSRYTGQEDVVVGTPMANRRRAELEGLIGFFVNALVLRTDLSGDPTFRELLGRVRAATLEAYAHQDVPFERLVEELQPERSLSQTPLFQVVLVLQNVPSSGLRLPGLSLEAVGVDSGAAKFDLTFVASETARGLAFTLEYNLDLFEHATVERLLRHFRTLLEEAAARPDEALRSLPLMTEAERGALLGEWRGAGDVYRRPESLPRLFEEQVRRTPDATALSFEDARLTYAELNRRANRVARLLGSLGVGPEVPVALCLERSAEMVVAVLGVLKAGGAYLPLDPAYPQERLRFMLEDARPPVLLTESRFAQALPPFAGRVVALDAERELVAGFGDEDPPCAAAPDNTAYIIYTSGSTGRAKGALVTHSNVTRLFAATDEWFAFGGSDVWTLFHSYAFDFSVWELWGALLHGGRLVVVPYWVSRTPEAFYELLREEGVTVLNQTPSAFRQLMAAEESRESSAELSLRLVIFGGEALDPGSLRPWVARHGDERPQLINMYGITETTVHVTYRRLTAADVGGARGSVIGRAIPDLEVYVLDERMEPSPVGVAGEMYVGGAGLARGYLDRPGLTAERFVPHPFGEEPGARLYRTGDRARYLGAGDIEYLGRVDHQVKVRGFRIELGEIESVLGAHEAVREAVVVALAESQGDKRLVAYVTLRQSVTAGELRAFVGAKLPDYMVPAAFVILERLPLTPNGKIDLRALPALAAARRAPETDYVAPRTEAEALLAVIWEDVLGLERVGVHDNFFALGGDSVRSVRLLALAKDRGLDFSLQQLFRHQTIAELARDIARTDAGAEESTAPEPFSLVPAADRARMPAEVEDAYPLTMLQGGMLFHMALTPDAPVYHNVNSWHLRAPFDGARFDEAVQRAVARHAILRTSFDLTSFGEPLQLVHRQARLPVGVTDISHLSPEEQSAALDAFVEAEKTRRFDLSRPPLLRFHIHLRTPESFQFTLTESHPIFDGWSLNATLAEIFTTYFALLRGESPAPEPPPAVAFSDFIRLEREALESEECRRFWDEKLSGLVPTGLPRWPASRREPGGQRMRQLGVNIPPEVSEGLHEAAHALKVPVKSVLLAAHMKVLSVLGGSEDVVSGLVTNGRPERLDGEEVRGMFLNTVPFRLRLPAGATWAELVRETFEAEWELLPFRRFPLLAAQRRAGGQTLFEAQFNFVHFHMLEGILRSGDVEVLSDDKKRVSEEAHFPLTAAFSMSLFGRELFLSLQYDAAELAGEQVAEFAGYYLEALGRIAREPSARHDSRGLLSHEEERRLLSRWNDTARPYARQTCLHEMFERQAARTPDAVAVECDNDSLTYSELNSRANRLARHLRSLGVGPESLVGLLMERSAELVVALLAVQKAGGAYLPLDPDYPAERLRFMLADSGAAVLLAERRLAERLPGLAARIVCADADRAEIERQGAENLSPSAGAENLAYVIYTSGSTGRPKGAMLAHREVVNCVEWMQETYRLGERDRFLFKTSLNFDASVWEVFWPLAVGARVVVARPGGQHDGAYLADTIVKRHVTAAYFVPSLLALFLEEPGLAHAASLRYVICGGESLPASAVARFHERLPHVALHHSYGPTETAIAASEITCPRDGEWAVMPIGRPLGNYRLYVLDRGMRPVPVGVAGELYVGGAGVGRGYLNRAALTAERFVPDPFSEEPGARLYRTGDLCRYLPDGNLEFRGRVDAQLKVRGMRVEPGEIEAAVREQAGVRDCVVAARAAAGGEWRLVAYVVPEAGGELSREGLRERLSLRLPRHMVPSEFVFLDALPMLPNGKLDPRGLPEPEDAGARPQTAFVAPRSEWERRIAAIWAEVLGREEVGVEDNFFDLGGHSLRMLQVHLKLRAALGRELPLTDLFQYPTVGALAKHLSRGPAEPDATLATSVERGARRRTGAAQQRTRREGTRAGGAGEGD